ncbi:MAG TPA: SDR family oxidoreductase [Amycolatopsis sp.]|nr:SDR family oxidoreductase [Amycolatopsis sp.]
MVKVLVTGATGNVGTHVVSELRARGAQVRAFVRDAGKAASPAGDGVEVAVGDFEDAASLRNAVEGVDLVFVTSADGPRKVEHENAIIDAAAAAPVRFIVKLSALGAATDATLGFSRWHGLIEEHLRASGKPWVVLRAGYFMTNLLASAEAVRQTGKLFAPADDAKIAMIDPRDVAATAAAVLTGRGNEGRGYLLTGPEAITYAEVAAYLSAATGRDIEFVDVSDDAARSALSDSGAPPWLVDNLIILYGLLRQGFAEPVTHTVEALTGRYPRTFAEFARDHAALFRT